MKLAEDSADGNTALEDGPGEEPATEDTDLESTVMGLCEGAHRAVEGGVDGDRMAKPSEFQRSIHHQPLSTADAKIRMDERNPKWMSH